MKSTKLMTSRAPAVNRTSQRGVALMVGIIFIAILSLFVLGAMRDVLLQERMSGAYRSSSLAQSAVDSVLRNAENDIYTRRVTVEGIPEYFPIDNELGGVPAALTSFRTGAGYVGTAATSPCPLRSVCTPSNAFSSGTYADSALARTGSYTIEGPILITGDDGYPLEYAGEESGGGGAGAKGKAAMYRITARAAGGSDSFVRAAESNYIVTY
jgi:type IV pilus assembly protein PilX